MILPVILSKIGAVAKSVAGNGMLLAKKHAPEIMITSGILGFGGAIYETVKATNKTNDILEEKERINRLLDLDDHDQKIANRNVRFAIIKAWAPVATLGIASTASILGGYRILNGRYVATAAAYKVLENGFERYRGNVVNRYGKDVDWDLQHDIPQETLDKARKEQAENREIEADNKRKKLGKKRKKTAYSDIYNFIFDEYSDRWQRYWTPDQVLHYLKTKEDELNDRLMIKGHVLLNDVYDALGMERTAAGCVVGWLKSCHERVDIQNRNVVQIVSNIPESEIREILSAQRNEDIRVRICPNPDGLIYNLIDGGLPTGEGLCGPEREKLAYYD